MPIPQHQPLPDTTPTVTGSLPGDMSVTATTAMPILPPNYQPPSVTAARYYSPPPGQYAPPGHYQMPHQAPPGSYPGYQQAPSSGALEPLPPLSAANMGKHRAIDALSHVDVKTGVKQPSQRGWRHALYAVTRINLGLSPDELYQEELNNRIRRNTRDSYQIGIVGLKGGVGKTSVAVALGSALARIRGDRILAIDANPDSGNLADRSGRQSAASVADLLSDKELARYNDIRAHTSLNDSNLEVLASEDYSEARREFRGEDWKAATGIVSRYYNLVLADCGAGLFTSAAQSVLSTVSGLVIVANATIDGARQAAVTLDWLRQNGFQDLIERSCVVINHTSPGNATVNVPDVIAQFERHVQAGRVIELPWDKHIAAGSPIDFTLLGKTYKRRITELAAALSDDFDKVDRR